MDHDDGGTYVQYARLPRNVDKTRVMSAMADTFSHWGCSHEYDCCGCQLVRAEVHKTRKSRVVRLVLSVGYNY